MKKKVLFTIHQLTVGGSQSSLFSALNAIDYDKYDVTLYVRRNKIPLIDKVNRNVRIIINNDNHHYYRKPFVIILTVKANIAKIFKKYEKAEALQKEITKKINFYRLKFESKHYFKKQRYDVAISYISGWNSLLIPTCVNAIRKICYHFVSIVDEPDVYREYFPKYDCIVADSEGSADSLRVAFPKIKDRFVVIKNYIDYSQILAKANEEFIFEYSQKYLFVSCARFTRPKGFDLAVKAANILKNKNIDFLWVFIGDGPERNNIESLISEYGLENNIYITGIMDNPYPLFKRCNLYIHPSYEESYGLTITTAKMLCKPIVTTKTAGGTEQIDNRVNGILTDISPESLAAGIIEFIYSPELIDKIVSALEEVDYSKDLEEYKGKIQKLLEGN